MQKDKGNLLTEERHLRRQGKGSLCSCQLFQLNKASHYILFCSVVSLESGVKSCGLSNKIRPNNRTVRKKQHSLKYVQTVQYPECNTTKPGYLKRHQRKEAYLYGERLTSIRGAVVPAEKPTHTQTYDHQRGYHTTATDIPPSSKQPITSCLFALTCLYKLLINQMQSVHVDRCTRRRTSSLRSVPLSDTKQIADRPVHSTITFLPQNKLTDARAIV